MIPQKSSPGGGGDCCKPHRKGVASVLAVQVGGRGAHVRRRMLGDRGGLGLLGGPHWGEGCFDEVGRLGGQDRQRKYRLILPHLWAKADTGVDKDVGAIH